MGKRKFTAQQARAALLSAGVEMIDGICPASVAAVSLAEAISRSGTPRPSAYRVFGGSDLSPQEAFQEELLLRIIEIRPGMDLDVLADAIRPLLDQVNSAGSSPSTENLNELLSSVCCTWAETTVRFLLDDVSSGIYISAMALVRTGGHSARIETALKEHRLRMASDVGALHREMLTAFGLRLKPSWAEHELLAVCHDVTNGAVVASKATSDDYAAGVAIASLAATYMALVASATEPDPRRIVSARPADILGISPSELTPSA